MTPMELSVRIDGRTVIVRHSAAGEDIAPFEAPEDATTTGASVPVLLMRWHSLRTSPGVASRDQRVQNTSNARRL